MCIDWLPQALNPTVEPGRVSLIIENKFHAPKLNTKHLESCYFTRYGGFSKIPLGNVNKTIQFPPACRFPPSDSLLLQIRPQIETWRSFCIGYYLIHCHRHSFMNVYCMADDNCDLLRYNMAVCNYCQNTLIFYILSWSYVLHVFYFLLKRHTFMLQVRMSVDRAQKSILKMHYRLFTKTMVSFHLLH